MSKIIVYLLDKTVWLVIITVLTTQILQTAGIVERPRGAGDISYKQEQPHNFQMTHANLDRYKRETGEDRSQFIDMLFNIPIKTLTAMNNLIQKSRPALRMLREFAVKHLEKTSKAPDVNSNNIQKRSYPVYVRPKEEKN